MGNKDRISGWTIAGLILISTSIGFVIFSSAYPHWWESKEVRREKIKSIGLWEICFDPKGTAAPIEANDGLGNRYSGCIYVFDRDLREIVEWIFPDWYIVVVTFVTLTFLIQPVSVILVIIYMVRVCSPHTEHLLIGVTCLLNITNGVLTMIAILLFGLKTHREHGWMGDPSAFYLSYSYGMCAVVPVLCFFAAMCYAIDYLRLHTQRLINARAKVYAKGEFSNRY